MIAKEDFKIYLSKEDNLTSYYSGEDKIVKEISYKKGEEVPDETVSLLIANNPNYFELEYENGLLKLTEKQAKLFNLPLFKIVSKPFAPPRKYSEDKLVQIYNVGGQDALQKIAEEEFKIEVKPRAKYNTIITAILKKQEENRR